jgi:hypothetical protein
MDGPPRPPPSRRGLAEYVILVAVLIALAAGAVTLFGDALRARLGVPRPAPSERSRG